MTNLSQSNGRDSASRQRICDDLEKDLGIAMRVIDLLDQSDLLRPQRLRVAQAKSAMTSLGSSVERAVAALRDGESDTPEKKRLDAGMDDARFLRLLEIAGPRDSGELVARLHADLKAVRDGLVAAFDRQAPDWEAVRGQTHVLVALAGAVGADALHQLAAALNAAAHLRDAEGAASLRLEAIASLDHLIDYVARHDTTGTA